MTADLQRAQDLLTAMQAQRDQALNAVVHAQAELAARDRLLVEKDNLIAEQSATIAELRRTSAAEGDVSQDAAA